MQTTILNPTNPRRRRRATKRTVRRRNAEANPRRRRRTARRRYYRNAEANPRRRRRGMSRRRNPASNPEINFGRILYANGGGLLSRFAMRKIAGKRILEEGKYKLDTMHYISALGAIYFGQDIASAIGATPDEARSFSDGAAAVAGQMLIDQHMAAFSAEYLMPFASPTPTGDDMRGIGRGNGAAAIAGIGTRENPMPYDRYMKLAGIGQLPPGGVYVRGADGSVWWFPGSRGRAVAGLGCAGCSLGAGAAAPSGMRELPDHIRAGAVVRDTDTGERFVVGTENGKRVLIPAGGAAGVGADSASYFGLVAAR